MEVGYATEAASRAVPTEPHSVVLAQTAERLDQIEGELCHILDTLRGPGLNKEEKARLGGQSPTQGVLALAMVVRNKANHILDLVQAVKTGL